MAPPRLARPYRPAAIARLQIRLEDFLSGVDETVPSESGQLVNKLNRAHTDLLKARKDQQEAAAAATLKGGGVGADPALDARVRKIQRSIASMTKQTPTPAPYSQQAGDIYSVEFTVVPLTASCELNTYKIPDTLEMTFAFKDAPLIDQIIRACLVEFFSGEVDANDFGTPQRWALPQDRSNLMFRGYADKWKVKHSDGDSTVTISCRSLECILVDAKINPLAKVYQVQDAKGHALVEEPIDEYVNRILRQFPATSGKTGGDALRAIMYKAASAPKLSRAALIRTLQTAKSTNAANGATPGNPNPIPAAPVDAGGTAPGQTAGVGTPQIPQAIPAGMSAWDLITQACTLVGMKAVYDPSIKPQLQIGIASGIAQLGFGLQNAANPLAEAIAATGPQAGDVILIMPLAVITETATGDVTIPGGAPDQFERRFSLHGESPQQSNIRIFAWGRNVKSADTERKLGRIKAPAVQVRSYNPDGPPGKRMIIAQFPTKKMINALYAKGDARISQVEIREVDGIRDPDLLQQIAVSLYHEMGRQELSVTIETDELSSYYDPTLTDGERNADVLKLRPATPVRLMVARDTVDPAQGITPTTLQDLFVKAPDALRAVLFDQGRKFNPQMADMQLQKVVQSYLDRIATATTSARLTEVFYTRTVRHTWSFEDGEGWSAEIIMSNYVEARALPRNISKQDDAINNAQNPTTTITPQKHQQIVNITAQSRLDAALGLNLVPGRLPGNLG